MCCADGFCESSLREHLGLVIDRITKAMSGDGEMEIDDEEEGHSLFVSHKEAVLKAAASLVGPDEAVPAFSEALYGTSGNVEVRMREMCHDSYGYKQSSQSCVASSPLLFGSGCSGTGTNTSVRAV